MIVRTSDWVRIIDGLRVWTVPDCEPGTVDLTTAIISPRPGEWLVLHLDRGTTVIAITRNAWASASSSPTPRPSIPVKLRQSPPARTRNLCAPQTAGTPCCRRLRGVLEVAAPTGRDERCPPPDAVVSGRLKTPSSASRWLIPAGTANGLVMRDPLAEPTTRAGGGHPGVLFLLYSAAGRRGRV